MILRFAAIDLVVSHDSSFVLFHLNGMAAHSIRHELFFPVLKPCKKATSATTTSKGARVHGCTVNEPVNQAAVLLATESPVRCLSVPLLGVMLLTDNCVFTRSRIPKSLAVLLRIESARPVAHTHTHTHTHQREAHARERDKDRGADGTDQPVLGCT